ALKVASRTVTQEGIHVLTALAQTRTDLREELQHDAGGIDRTQFADLVKRLAGVETDVNRQLGALNERFRTVDNRFGEFERELNDSLSTVVRVDEIDSIRNQLTDLSRRIGEFRGTFSDRLATLEGDNERLRTNLEGFGRTLTTLQQNVRGLEGSLDERLAAKIDTGTFDDFQNQINQALRGKVNVVTHTQLRAEFTKGLAALQEAASRIDNDLLTLRRRVDERFPRP
ncbi:MAG: hypothetical protein KDE58_32970, partial [Caldilineaceae bacterium]|nr:hypothetical protein [Caldilineaceae bacterium]